MDPTGSGEACEDGCAECCGSAGIVLAQRFHEISQKHVNLYRLIYGLTRKGRASVVRGLLLVRASVDTALTSPGSG